MLQKKKNSRLPPRVVTKDDVERAMRNTTSNKMASKFLGIDFKTWKKWASTYVDNDGVSLYTKHNNKAGLGIKKFRRKDNDKVLADVLNGRTPVWWISSKDIKERLIIDGYFEEKCDRCGYCDKRNLDLKVPLLLHFRDLNKKNIRLDNIQLLCYNCYFIAIGDVFDKSQIKVLERYDKSKSKKIDLDLPKAFEKEYDEIMSAYSKKEEYNSDKLEDYIDKPKEPVVEKEDPIVEPEESVDEDFGLDLLSYLKR